MRAVCRYLGCSFETWERLRDDAMAYDDVMIVMEAEAEAQEYARIAKQAEGAR